MAGRRMRTSVVTLAVIASALCTAMTDSVRRDGPVDPTFGTHAPSAQLHHKVILPTRQRWEAANGVASPTGQVGIAASGSGPLAFGGGIDGIGVTITSPKVYLVFWGSQWGASTTGGDGLVRFAGDSAGIAPRVQAFVAGLGTGSERWSAIVTQYCDAVPIGSTTCAATSPHVPFPSSGVLAGVWADTSAAAPTTASDQQIANEAVATASHFGNTTAVSNRSVQYVVISPHNTHPGGFGSAGFCAWHSAELAPAGWIAFTNLPYISDLGASCGANYVHAGAAGTLDGVSIIEGHEYAETLTDQIPPGGWFDAQGYEIADKCAWIGVGATGGAQDLVLATGSFPVAGLWSNDDGACVVAHGIVDTTPTEVVLAVGSPLTQDLMDEVLANAGQYNLHAIATAPKVVPGDASCATVTYGTGPGMVPPPVSTDEGLVALRDTIAGLYPNAAAGAGRGCVDIVRSDLGP